MRLDVYLTEQGYAESRARAKRLIESGCVMLNGVAVNKPAFEIQDEPTVSIKTDRYVGRGGEKLEGALRAFSIDPTGLMALDVGASTGGFTDCLLQSGAAHVVAVDAGFGQLHPKLLKDERVTNIEKYNARQLSCADTGKADLIVMDVSFISQTYILPRFPDILTEKGQVVSLIKPQFEAGRGALNKKGIVKDPRDKILAIRRVLDCATECGLACCGLMPSPILGGDGNEEYLAHFKHNAQKQTPACISIEKTVLERTKQP